MFAKYRVMSFPVLWLLANITPVFVNSKKHFLCEEYFSAITSPNPTVVEIYTPLSILSFFICRVSSILCAVIVLHPPFIESARGLAIPLCIYRINFCCKNGHFPFDFWKSLYFALLYYSTFEVFCQQFFVLLLHGILWMSVGQSYHLYGKPFQCVGNNFQHFIFDECLSSMLFQSTGKLYQSMFYIRLMSISLCLTNALLCKFFVNFALRLYNGYTFLLGVFDS